MTNAQKLAQWIIGYRAVQTESADLERAKDLLLDHLGVLLVGAAEAPSARAGFDYAAALGGAAEATLLSPNAARVPAESAAFAHAAAAHAVELDDIHNPSSAHPGVAVIPAALAVAEAFDRSGREPIEAILVGYEVMLRVGEAAGPTAVYGRGFHPTAVCGPFGAVAAAARLMRLDVERTVHALGIAWSFAAGNMSFQTEGSWIKRLQVGGAASAGVRAARLASLGATGPSRVFEADGFFASYAGRFDEAKLLGGLGERLKIGEVGLKPFACCRYSQTPLDALLELRAERAIDPGRVRRIRIEIASTGLPLVALPIERKRAPRDEVEAQFSLPYAAAAALISGRAGREQFREPSLSDRRVLELASRVEIGSDERIDALFPDKWAARVRVELEGETRERFAEDCLGDPAKPMNRAAVREKFDSLASAAIDADSRRRVAELVAEIDRRPRAAELVESLAAGFMTAGARGARGKDLEAQRSIR
jgi:2-methylcitrate dehydratase PrpD